MKLISVIIAWCSCKGPGRSHLLLMAYAAHAFAGAPIKQTGLQKLVRCTPISLLSTLLSNVGLFLPPDIFHISHYRQQGGSLSLTTFLCITALCVTFSVATTAHTSAQEYPDYGSAALGAGALVQGDWTENESSRFCSATDLAHHLRQIT